MKFTFGLLLFISTVSYGQDIRLEGFYTYYESEDSTAVLAEYHTTLIYNSSHEKVYEEYRLSLGDPDSDIFFEDTRQEHVFINGRIYGTDTVKYVHIEDCELGKKFRIEGNDTTIIYSIKCQDQRLTEMHCIKGCDYSDSLIIDPKTNTEYWRTTYANGDTFYSSRQFDRKKRVILFRNMIPTIHDSIGPYVKISYDDDEHVETVVSSNTFYDDKIKDTVITYYDDDWIPIKKEVIEMREGKKTLRRFEFRRIE